MGKIVLMVLEKGGGSEDSDEKGEQATQGRKRKNRNRTNKRALRHRANAALSTDLVHARFQGQRGSGIGALCLSRRDVHLA